MQPRQPDRCEPLRIGHRGAAGYAPENTLAAIRTAISLQVDMVEVDVRATADGRLVLLHDETVDRTTDGTGLISRLSLAQAQRLTIGGDQQIPTLEEALNLVTEAMGIILEIKADGIGASTHAAVMKAGVVGTIFYASFLPEELARVHAAAPDAKLMLLIGNRSASDPLCHAAALKASHLGLDYRAATPARVRACQDAGLQVFVYTVNSPSDIARMRSLQVKGIVSDYPDRI